MPPDSPKLTGKGAVLAWVKRELLRALRRPFSGEVRRPSGFRFSGGGSRFLLAGSEAKGWGRTDAANGEAHERLPQAGRWLVEVRTSYLQLRQALSVKSPSQMSDQLWLPSQRRRNEICPSLKASRRAFRGGRPGVFAAGQRLQVLLLSVGNHRPRGADHGGLARARLGKRVHEPDGFQPAELLRRPGLTFPAEGAASRDRVRDYTPFNHSAVIMLHAR